MGKRKDFGIPDPVVTQVTVELAAGHNLLSREEFLSIPIAERLKLIMNKKVQFLDVEGIRIPSRIAVAVIGEIQKFERIFKVPELENEKEQLIFHIIRSMGGEGSFKLIQKNLWNVALEEIETLEHMQKLAKHLFRQKGIISLIGQYINNTCLRVARKTDRLRGENNVA